MSPAASAASKRNGRPTAGEARWTSRKRHQGALITAHLDTGEEIGLVHTALIKTGQRVRNSFRANGDGPLWKELTNKSEAKRTILCKHLDGKALFTRLRRLCSVVHRRDEQHAPA